MAKEEEIIYDNYKKILDNVSKLSEELNFNSPIELLVYCKTLISRGDLSENHKFKNGSNGMIAYEDGTTIMDGKGNSSHTSSFLSDILNKRGYEAAPMPILPYPWRILNIFKGPHNVTFCLDSKKYNLLDIKNADFLNIGEDGIITSVLNDKRYISDLKRIDDNGNPIKRVILTRDEYICLLEQANQRCEDNNAAFEDLYSQNKQLIDGICYAKKREFGRFMDSMI